MQTKIIAVSVVQEDSEACRYVPLQLALQAMQCTIGSTWCNTHTIGDRENCSILSLEDRDCKASSNDHLVSSCSLSTSGRRGGSTFIAVEPEGFWRTDPLECPDHIDDLGSVSQVKMDGLLISPPLVSSVRASQQKTRRVPTAQRSYSVKPVPSRSFSGSKYQYQSRNKSLSNKESRWNALPGKFPRQTSLKSNACSVINSSDSPAMSSPNIHDDLLKVDQSVKRNTKKKTKKKGKRNAKLSGDQETVKESDSAIPNSTDNITRQVLDAATKLTLLSPRCTGSGNDSEENSSSICYSETPKTCISYIHEADVSEANCAEYSSSHSESGIQPVYSEFAVLNGFQETHPKSLSSLNDPCSSTVSEANDSSVLDSMSILSNGDESINTGYDAKLSNKDTSAIGVPEFPDCNMNSRCFPHASMLNSNGNSYCRTEFTNSSQQACTGCNMAKRGKQTRRVPQVSSVPRVNNGRRVYGRSGKENNHSIWQKVQRNDTDESICGLRSIDSADTQSAISLKEIPLVPKISDVAQSSVVCEDKDQSKVKASRKLKRKTSPISKAELNKGTHSDASKAGSNGCMKVSMQQSGVSDLPTQFSEQTGVNGARKSRSKSGSIRDVSQASTERESSSLHGFSDHHDQIELIEGNTHSSGAEGGTKIDKDVPTIEYSKQDHYSGSVLQKWKPVGVRSSDPSRSGHANSSSQFIYLKKIPAESSILGSGEMTCKAINPPSLADVGSFCAVQGSRQSPSLHTEDEMESQKRRSQCTYAPKDDKKFVGEVDSNKIVQAVNDSYTARLASEAVQMVTGSPIAEFERLLHSASPVISQVQTNVSCPTRLPHEVYSHETPSISLRNLWQWYEKQGTYGLEVRGEDFENSKRFGIDRFAFRAYFVPFLSAVQLFRNHDSCSRDDACKVGRHSGNSNIGGLPVFSVLAPQAHGEYSKSDIDNGTSGSDDCRSSQDLELLFEYFELEQPQRRRPLFDMIKELVKGDGPSKCRAYGDPTALDSVDLNDLHPSSWYSVAWYPIYRIPDGNFRAAFLTYHSLGHLVHRGSTDSLSADDCVISPVVGLQSYNAQGECWFQPRQSQVDETGSLNHLRVLKERLRTLEQTAALMARASMTKGDVTTVNRQPDYEFFLSRRRW